jgi:hypothetical protein
LAALDFELRASNSLTPARQALYHLSHSTFLFYEGIGSPEYLPGLASNHEANLCLPSRVARITGVSHQHPALMSF